MAAALYAACRDTATPRNLKDIEIAANIKRKDIAQAAGVTEVTIRNRYKGLKEALKL
jgi:transcription initiation factor TFIIB